MNREIKAKWIEALRSGKYEQGKSQLRTLNDKYCCLGILCTLRTDGEWKQWCEPDEDGLAEIGCWEFKGNSEWLDGSYLLEIGMTSEEESALADMNDSGKTFAEIADYIEKNL